MPFQLKKYIGQPLFAGILSTSLWSVLVYSQLSRAAHGLAFADALALVAPWLICLALPLTYVVIRIVMYRFSMRVNGDAALEKQYDHQNVRLQSL